MWINMIGLKILFNWVGQKGFQVDFGDCDLKNAIVKA